MAVTCKNCELAPVVCQIAVNPLEQLYCESCVAAIAGATRNVYDVGEADPADLALIDAAEAELQKLVDKGEWKP